MHRNLIRVSLAVALTTGSCLALAANGRPAAWGDQLRSDQLPDIQCSATRCTIVQRPSQALRPHTLTAAPMATPAVPDPTPVEVGPPAGQRFMWQGAGYPSCQSIIGVTSAAPYTYINASAIPVPLGSTHISFLASIEANMSGGPGGAGADFGEVQVKRSSGTHWTNADFGFIFSVYGSVAPQSLYNIGHFHGLVNLADLQDGTGVPSEIDVRAIVFPVYTSGFTNVVYNAVCLGKLQLSF